MSEERIITAAIVTTGEKNDRQDYCFEKSMDFQCPRLEELRFLRDFNTL